MIRRYLDGRYALIMGTMASVSAVGCSGSNGMSSYQDSSQWHYVQETPQFDSQIAGASTPANTPSGIIEQDDSLGVFSGNQYDPNSIANPYGQFGSPYSPNSIRNPYGAYGSVYSPMSATNPYAVNAPKLFAADGTYLGMMSANQYHPDSISNPYGRFGSKYSPDSINNPYGQYGNKYSPFSPWNPYSTQAPRLVAP